MTLSYDAIVIGGGSAGLAFSKRAAHHGASVLLIEHDTLGGTCVNRGCVPKKMMWSVADASQTQSNLMTEGIFDATAEINMDRFVARRDARIDDIVQSFQSDLDDKGITRIKGAASITDTVNVDGTSYASNHIVVATGARPSPLNIPGADLSQTSDDVFGWTDIPETLIVIGAGYIGCEMAAIFNGLGSDVTLVSDGSDVLSGFSNGSQTIAARNLANSGVALEFGAKPVAFTNDGDRLRVALDNGTKLCATHILNATGRDPNLDAFPDDKPALADNGALAINTRFETSVEGIYAIGDCADRLPLTPVARADGQTLADQLFTDTKPDPIDLNLVATTAFVFPPIGEVGTVDKITEINTFTAMDSMIEGDDLSEGWALQFSDDDHLSGAAVVGHAAAEAVSYAAQLIHAKRKRGDLKRATAVHPSRAEEALD